MVIVAKELLNSWRHENIYERNGMVFDNLLQSKMQELNESNRQRNRVGH